MVDIGILNTLSEENTPSDRLSHVMPPTHFFLLENILKSWFLGDKRRVTTQPLLDTLPENERWKFFDRVEDPYQPEKTRRYCTQVLEDIEHLHSRGYVHVEGKSQDDRTWLIDLTMTGLLAYKHVYNQDPFEVDWKLSQIQLLEGR